eukprot:CAMPEP_0113645032 /NCGR_PEP_ID=MMETSP0017_2-20120614/23715_1 /TAXON_ID=2856 /ORGANISM="Cylindrotheca closterium" /LENGTH=242 /DNA_ID=CAMNT_0000556703 /DNA_START=131 /DNA_END=856 /DNA_ORIENTATION=+ /assembly_acc=CAM_ASM_000147
MRLTTNAVLLVLIGCMTFEGASAFSNRLPTRPTITTMSNRQAQGFQQNANTSIRLYGMKRPILDQVATTLFKLENDRVEASSVADDQGRMGEPMEWSESDSFANRFSQIVQNNELGYQFKQFVADIVAGQDYDHEETLKVIDEFVASTTTSTKQPSMFGNFFSGEDGSETAPVAMFSFTTCPFCRRAKDYLDAEGIPYVSMELDELPGNQGNEIRASLGRKTRRTSVPSIFVQGEYIGGCND